MLSYEPWQRYIELAGHYKAIGQTSIYLARQNDTDLDAYPWHLVTQVDTGSSFRLGFSTDVQFLGKDEESGLTFRWSIGTEHFKANGSNHLQFEIPIITGILARLPEDVAPQFAKYLTDAADHIDKETEKWRADLSRYEHQATTFRLLSAKYVKTVNR